VLLLLGAAPAATGETRPLEPGAEVSSILSTLQPGDHLVLQPGRHQPLRLEGIHGTAAAPIVVRGGGRDRPGLIVGQRTGIEIIGCSHLVLEDLIVHGASESGVAMFGRSGSDTSDVVLRRVVVLGSPSESTATGVRVGPSRNVRLEQCRIERCGHAGVVLDGAQGARIIDLLLAGGSPQSRFGVQVLGATADARLAGMILSGGVRYGVALGVAEEGVASTDGQRPDAPKGPTAPIAAPVASRSIIIDQCVIGRCEAALLVGSVASCVVERTTIFSPRGALMEFLSAARPTDGPALTLRRNLLAWLPNEISSLARLPKGFDSGTVLLEENLWWSEDLRDRRGDYGPFPGQEVRPQILDLDPKLDSAGRPANEAAAGFGAS